MLRCVCFFALTVISFLSRLRFFEGYVGRMAWSAEGLYPIPVVTFFVFAFFFFFDLFFLLSFFLAVHTGFPDRCAGFLVPVHASEHVASSLCSFFKYHRENKHPQWR